MALRAGVDLGGTKIQAVVMDTAGQVLTSFRQPTPTAGGPRDVVAAVAAAVREAAAESGVELNAFAGVGVGSPGDVDDHAGTVTSARNLPGWTGSFPVTAVLGEELGVPVSLANDVDVATVAEYELGAGRAYSSLLGVFWGTGVGGGIVLDGKLWHGRASAGEIGHVVVKLDGARCPCGRKGCMEAYAGRGAMEARARKELADGRGTELFKIMEKRGRTRLTSGVFARALDHGDELAVTLIDRAIEALGAGIASAVNLLDVEAVIIGGGLGVRLGTPYAERIEQAMMPHLFSDYRPPAVQVAALGDLGGAIGAALLIPADRPAKARA
ncbi:MAG: ROK family protein [Solirubrobacterales bacterium]|nr:ROK family protein [Solirubrobacterales bacterium]